MLSLSELNQVVSATATKVYNHAMYQTKREDCDDIAESVAEEIIGLVEYMTEDCEHQGKVALRIVETYEMPKGAKAMVRKHFDLPY